MEIVLLVVVHKDDAAEDTRPPESDPRWPPVLWTGTASALRWVGQDESRPWSSLSAKAPALPGPSSFRAVHATRGPRAQPSPADLVLGGQREGGVEVDEHDRALDVGEVERYAPCDSCSGSPTLRRGRLVVWAVAEQDVAAAGGGGGAGLEVDIGLAAGSLRLDVEFAWGA